MEPLGDDAQHVANPVGLMGWMYSLEALGDVVERDPAKTARG